MLTFFRGFPTLDKYSRFGKVKWAVNNFAFRNQNENYWRALLNRKEYINETKFVLFLKQPSLFLVG